MIFYVNGKLVTNEKEIEDLEYRNEQIMRRIKFEKFKIEFKKELAAELEQTK